MSIFLSHALIILRRDLRRSLLSLSLWGLLLLLGDWMSLSFLDPASGLFQFTGVVLAATPFIGVLLSLSFLGDDAVSDERSHLLARPVGPWALLLAKTVLILLIQVLFPLVFRLPLWVLLGHSYEGLYSLASFQVLSNSFVACLCLLGIVVVRHDRGLIVTLILWLGLLFSAVLSYLLLRMVLGCLLSGSFFGYSAFLRSVSFGLSFLSVCLFVICYSFLKRRPARSFLWLTLGCFFAAPVDYFIIRGWQSWEVANPSPEIAALPIVASDKVTFRQDKEGVSPQLELCAVPDGLWLSPHQVTGVIGAHGTQTKLSSLTDLSFRPMTTRRTESLALGQAVSTANKLECWRAFGLPVDRAPWSLPYVSMAPKSGPWRLAPGLSTGFSLKAPALDVRVRLAVSRESVLLSMPLVAGTHVSAESTTLRVESCDVQGDALHLVLLRSGMSSLLMFEHVYLVNRSAQRLVHLNFTPTFGTRFSFDLLLGRLDLTLKASDLGLSPGLRKEEALKALSELSLVSVVLKPLGNKTISIRTREETVTFSPLSPMDISKLEQQVEKANRERY